MKLFSLPAIFFFFIVCLSALPACKNYGPHINFQSDVVYYESPVTKQQADSLGRFLKVYGYFQDKEYSVQLVNRGGYRFRMVLSDEALNQKESLVPDAQQMARDISVSVLGGEEIAVDFCDHKLRTVLAIPFVQDSAENEESV